LVFKFSYIFDQVLRNIATGVNAASGINIMQCKAIGQDIIDSMVGKVASDITFSKTSKAISMLDDSNPLKSGLVKMQPEKLFQRLITTSVRMKMNTAEIVENHELILYTKALFKTREVMHPANKPDFRKEMCDKWTSTQPSCDMINDATYIFDGGNLLHKCSWSKGQTISQLCNMYVYYLNTYYIMVNSHFKHIVVFDGYPECSTKDSAHIYRNKGVVGPDVNFAKDTVITMGKALFLSNTHNKIKFIKVLSEFLEQAGYLVRICTSDADKEIVSSAIAMSQMTHTIIVGEDTDLYLLSMVKWKQTDYRLIIKSSMAKKEKCYTDIGHVCVNTPKHVLENLFFPYVVTGCDTSSRIFNVGKGYAMQLIDSSSQFLECSKVFNNPNSSKEIIIETGEKAFLLLYGSTLTTLAALRRKIFLNKVEQHTESVDIGKYPPTFDSAMYHSLRVYHQIMEWNDVVLDPEEYGFYKLNGMLLPVTGTANIAPLKSY